MDDFYQAWWTVQCQNQVLWLIVPWIAKCTIKRFRGAGVVDGGVTVRDAWSGVVGVIKESQRKLLKGRGG